MSESLTAVGYVKFDEEQQLTVFNGYNSRIVNHMVRQSSESDAPLRFAGVQDFTPYVDETLHGLSVYPLAEVDQDGQIRRVHGVVDFLVEDWPMGKYDEKEFIPGEFRRQKQSVPLEDRMRVHMYEGARLAPICRGLATVAIQDYSKYRMLSPTYAGIYAEVDYQDVYVQEALLHLAGSGIGFRPVGSSHDGRTQAYIATLDELDQMLQLRGQDNPQ